MPLKLGKENVGENIKKEMEHGKSKDQAIAISINFAREHGADMPPPKEKKRSAQMDAIKHRMSKKREAV